MSRHSISFQSVKNYSFALLMLIGIPGFVSAECVYLKKLQAQQKEKDNLLSWTTLSETDHAFFLIERSLNGLQFEEAGRVEGQGTSTESQSYTFTDINNPGLRVFYRLVEVDLTGKVGFTNTVLISRKDGDVVFEITSMESSIVDHYLNLTVHSKVAGTLEYRLQTRMGEVLHKGVTPVVEGENALSVDLHEAVAGMYQFSIRIKNEIEVVALQKVDEPVVPESILSTKED